MLLGALCGTEKICIDNGIFVSVLYIHQHRMGTQASVKIIHRTLIEIRRDQILLPLTSTGQEGASNNWRARHD